MLKFNPIRKRKPDVKTKLWPFFEHIRRHSDIPFRKLALMAGAAGLSNVLILATVSVAWQLTADDDATIVRLPSEYHFACTKCGHQWSTDKANVTTHFGGGQPTTLSPVDCPSCNKPDAAYMKAKCLWCNKHYVHAHLLNPTGQRPTKDICPHCNKDVMTWRK